MGHNTTKSSIYRNIFIAVIVATIPLYLIKSKLEKLTENKASQQAEYVGHEKCIECHTAEYKDWKQSHHYLAMAHASDSSVLGDFNNTTFTSKDGVESRFYKKDSKYYVFTKGEGGKMKEYEVKFTFGYTPLQQYLVETTGGRLQTLSLTWNTLDSCWYSMADSIYKNENITHDNWLFWTNQAQNWNSMCADCHSTNLQKGYDVNTDTYHTTYSEINVSCEQCHGPGSKHLEWAELPSYLQKKYDNYGLVRETDKDDDNKEYVDKCARCHSRRVSYSDDMPKSHSIYNHMLPNLPVEPEYFIDGQIKDEDYVYGSFTQSRMYMNDVKCNDCHNVHSTKRLFDDNRLCYQCHKKDDYGTKKHHFHKFAGEKGEAVVSESGKIFGVGEGTKCINCHMPGRFYMGVDYRRDHSFRIPRPDLTIENGSPNACNNCHADKSPEWAESYIKKWHGQSRPYQYGEAFDGAVKGDTSAFTKLKGIIEDDLYPEIVRAVAIQYVGLYFQQQGKSLLYRYMSDMHPLLRHSALHNLTVNSQECLNKVLPLLSDEVKAVRVEAVAKVMTMNPEMIPANYKEAFKKGEQEYLETLNYNADFPVGKFNLGNFYNNTGEYKKAEKFYLAALKQDKELHVIKVNLAYLYNSMGEQDKAIKLFADYLKYNPNDANVLFAYGLLLSEMKEYDESLKIMIRASENQPDNARILFNIGNMYDFMGDKKQAEKYLKRAIQKEEWNSNYYISLLNFYIKNNKVTQAKQLAKDILKRFPDINDKESLENFISQ